MKYMSMYERILLTKKRNHKKKLKQLTLLDNSVNNSADVPKDNADVMLYDEPHTNSSLSVARIYRDIPSSVTMPNAASREKIDEMVCVLNETDTFSMGPILNEAVTPKHTTKILDVSRGNPNFVNINTRGCFALLHQFALDMFQTKGAGNQPNVVRIMPGNTDDSFMRSVYDNLHAYANQLHNNDDVTLGGSLLKAFLAHCESKVAATYADEQNCSHADAAIYIVQDILTGVIGCQYPTPPDMSHYVRHITSAFLKKHLWKSRDMPPIDLIATEGASAGLSYIIDALFECNLLKRGDTIGVLTPVYAPYIEMSASIPDRALRLIKLSTERMFSSSNTEEIAKIKQIKVLFSVNPTNPESVPLPRETVHKVVEMMNAHNPRMLIVSDSAYGSFTHGECFYDFPEAAPKNSIGIFSFSKLWGVTGWRMGIVFMAQDNIIDNGMLLQHKTERSSTDGTSLITKDRISRLNFIKQVLKLSRNVVNGHTAGLSTPQQVYMSICAVHGLVDSQFVPYVDSVRDLLRKRAKGFVQPFYDACDDQSRRDVLDELFCVKECNIQYYILLDIPTLGGALFGQEMEDQLMQSDPMVFVATLALNFNAIVFPGSGFGGNPSSVRISFSNLEVHDYTQLSMRIIAVLRAFREQ